MCARGAAGQMAHIYVLKVEDDCGLCEQEDEISQRDRTAEIRRERGPTHASCVRVLLSNGEITLCCSPVGDTKRDFVFNVRQTLGERRKDAGKEGGDLMFAAL